MNWAAKQRQIFIRERLNETGQINRADIMKEFGISVAQASLDLSTFRDQNPRAVVYDLRAKTYLKRETSKASNK